MSDVNQANKIWQNSLITCYSDYNFVSNPRGMEVRELLGATYTVKMPAYLDLKARNLNLAFMFAEAAWIISGSNALDELTDYMKSYANFSDDGLFLSGAYGPMIVDGLPYILKTLLTDSDSRQAYLRIWRDRPSGTKDVPCTTGMQFFIREGNLHMISNMRSNDVVLGLTFDIFSFSMVAKAVQLLLREKGVKVNLGSLTVMVGSLHLYERHYDNVQEWFEAEERDEGIKQWVNQIEKFETYKELKDGLKNLAHEAKFYRNRYE